MADAFIRGIAPVLNKKMGGTKFPPFRGHGKNLQATTKVVVKLGKHEWENDGPGDLVGDTLLVKLKKTKTVRLRPKLLDLEQITVTVANPTQTTPDVLLPAPIVATFAQP